MRIFEKKSKAAFTLIELLVVIAIIGILAGMLLAGIGAVRKMVRRVKGYSECEQLESGLEQYYLEYKTWPLSDAGDIVLDSTKPLLQILQGTNYIDGAIQRNPKKFEFMKFTKFDTAGDPVSPWNTKYYVRFDQDFDNMITAAGGSEPQTDVRKRVIVWTLNADKNENIGSWER